ncbi:hypothetical protein [Ferrithrix thermotolerans]|nr:hypothetical protein [Ferrithrix thermotolerans]
MGVEEEWFGGNFGYLLAQGVRLRLIAACDTTSKINHQLQAR